MVSDLEKRMPADRGIYGINPRRYKEASVILKINSVQKVEAIPSLVERRDALRSHKKKLEQALKKAGKNEWSAPEMIIFRNYDVALGFVLKHIFHSGSGWTMKSIESLLPLMDSHGYGNVLALCEHVSRREAMTPVLIKRFSAIKLGPDHWGNMTKETRQYAARIAALLGKKQALGWDTGDPWASSIQKQFKGMPKVGQNHWRAIIQHAAEASGTKPGLKWSKQAGTLLEPITEEDFIERVSAWLRLVTPPPVKYKRGWAGKLLVRNDQPIRDRNAEILRGLVWMCGQRGHESLAAPLGDLALVCLKKYPGYPAFCVIAGNACVDVLSGMKGNAPMAQLSRLQSLL